MSDYYQQQVTMYMMRRARRRAAEVSADAADTPVEDNPAKGSWLARLGSLFAKFRVQRPIAPAVPQKRTKPAR